MALVLKDRVQETCTSPGTGDVSLLGATTGYQTFSSAIGNGNTCYYAIADQGGANWEVGLGTYVSSGNVLQRTTIFASSNSGSTVNFSTGVQTVFVTYPSSKSVNLDSSNNVSPLGTISSGTWQGNPIGVLYGGTGVTTSTGTGSVVLSNSPALTTPNLGTPSAVTLTNAVGLPLSTGVSGILPTANGGTNLSSFTANGAVYATSTSALTTGTLPITSGGTGATTNTAAITNLGATTLGANIFTITNPSAITFPRFNADNTVSSLSASDFRTAIGAGTSSTTGTVTSVGGTGTVNGITLTGTVTSSGNLTLGGTLSGVSLTSQVSGTLPVANGGTGVTTSTGSGSVVLSTSPTLVTPVLGTPTSGNLSNCTADGTDAVGFKNIPQNSQSAAYTLVLADAGKHIFHPVGDNNARTFTIPANSSVAYPIGTAITFINMAVANVTIAITTDTLTLSPAGTAGSRTLATNGSATCIKITSTQWLISGSGLT